MTCSCPSGDGSPNHPCSVHPAPAAPGPRLLTELEGEVVNSISELESAGKLLAQVLVQMVDADQGAVDRAMIAFERSIHQLKQSVTHKGAVQ